MKNLPFQNKSNKGQRPPEVIDHLVSAVQHSLNSNGASFAPASMAKNAMSMESIDKVDEAELMSAMDRLNISLEEICKTHKIPATNGQKTAAMIAGIVAGDPEGFLKAPIKHVGINTATQKFIQPTGGEYHDSRVKTALEAFDEKENKNVVTYSVVYNMAASRQDEFGETFFPTVVVSPDQPGYSVSIRLIQVMNEVRHGIAGDITNFGKRNIIQAVIDPTILRNDQTKIVPVFKDETEHQFVADTLLTPTTVLVDGVSITTSALAVNKEIDLLGISQTDALLATGMMDSTDSIDTQLALQSLYIVLPETTVSGVTIAAEVLRFNTERLPTATFTHAIQGLDRQMNLSFDTKSLLVNKNVKQSGGATSVRLASVVSGEWSVRLGVNVSGSVNLELGNTTAYANTVQVISVTNNAGVQQSLTSGAGQTIKNLFANASVVGYDLTAQRTNLNRRQRGQLLDTTYYNQTFMVPLRAPISIPRPQTTGDQNDSSDLAGLITATRIRTSNMAVYELLKAEELLRDYVNNVDNLANNPDILGIARFLVQPYYEHFPLDVSTVIDSLVSHQRADDIQATLVNKLRDMVYLMYRDSGYKAAADSLAGGVAPVPTVIIGTDQILSRYLTVTGDLRTLGNEFNVKIVSTQDVRMSGKIIMSFGQFGGENDGIPNPMHFGNMAWKPELTVMLPTVRNGSNAKELTVQPAFLHTVNLPIMASITVTGISDTVNKKVAIDMNAV